MALDRNRLEQEAMAMLQKGQTDKAIAHYLKLLRMDPRDRRIRQKLAELYLSEGRTTEAERYFRDIAKQLVEAGQERAAIAVVKQLVKLRPDDPELLELLGDCYRVSGFPVDARSSYERAVESYGRARADMASRTLEKLIRMAPGEVPLQVQLAETYERANWGDKAFDQWAALARESQRQGRPDDRARFLEQALRLRKRPEALLGAAEARLAMGAPGEALGHLQAAYELDSSDPQTLVLLGRAFEDLGQATRARPIWLRAAAQLEGGDDPAAHAEALRRAIACGATSEALAQQLAEADRLAAAQALRLHTQPWAQPTTLEEGMPFVRALTQWRYGFPEKGLATLQATKGDVRKGTSIRVLLAELLSQAGQIEEAQSELRSCSAPDQGARDQLGIRLSVLSGHQGEAEDGPQVDDLLDDELIDDELVDDLDEGLDGGFGEDLDDEPTDEPTAGGSGEEVSALEDQAMELTRAGQVEEAVSAWKAVLSADPTHEGALMRIAELMAGTWDQEDASESGFDDDLGGGGFGGGGFGEPDFGELLSSGGTYAEVNPQDPAFQEAFAAPPPSPGLPASRPRGSGPASGAEADAQALLTIGAFSQARAALQGVHGLSARALEGRAWNLGGDTRRAIGLLRDAIAEAEEEDPGYGECLIELASAHANAGKGRAARRVVAELEDLDRPELAAAIATLARAIDLVGG